jgi:hypothetical protein
LAGGFGVEASELEKEPYFSSSSLFWFLDEAIDNVRDFILDPILAVLVDLVPKSFPLLPVSNGVRAYSELVGQLQLGAWFPLLSGEGHPQSCGIEFLDQFDIALVRSFWSNLFGSSRGLPSI